MATGWDRTPDLGDSHESHGSRRSTSASALVWRLLQDVPIPCSKCWGLSVSKSQNKKRTLAAIRAHGVSTEWLWQFCKNPSLRHGCGLGRWSLGWSPGACESIWSQWIWSLQAAGLCICPENVLQSSSIDVSRCWKDQTMKLLCSL